MRVKGRENTTSCFSESLKRLRIANGRKQREVAEALGIRLRSYQAYEGGEREPSIDNLIALADFFNVSLDVLVGRRDDAP